VRDWEFVSQDKLDDNPKAPPLQNVGDPCRVCHRPLGQLGVLTHAKLGVPVVVCAWCDNLRVD